MPREITITVDDDVYEVLKPLAEQHILGSFLAELLRLYGCGDIHEKSISALRGTLRPVITADIREDDDRLPPRADEISARKQAAWRHLQQMSRRIPADLDYDAELAESRT